MKVCGRCGEEIATKDGDNYCQPCDDMEDVRKRRKTSLSRKQRDDVMRSLGLVKVRGALGGTYWE